MRKIKNFKINLRVREITRVIKKLTQSPEITPELETAVARACRSYEKILRACAVYDTFAKDSSTDFVYDKDEPEKWVARSFYFITVGDAILEEYKKKGDVFGEHTGKIVSAAAVDALAQAKNFIARLLSDEAEGESCELSRDNEIPKDLYEKAAAILPADKIGVSLQDGNLSPQYSSCGFFYWIPSKKRNRK